MAQIKVNHQRLRELAGAIDTYCSTQNSQMRTADQAVGGLLSQHWVGLDAQAFSEQWQKVDQSGSTAVVFRDSLKNFGEALRASADEYQNAQTDVYNRANFLPKYIVW